MVRMKRQTSSSGSFAPDLVSSQFNQRSCIAIPGGQDGNLEESRKLSSSAQFDPSRVRRVIPIALTGAAIEWYDFHLRDCGGTCLPCFVFSPGDVAAIASFSTLVDGEQIGAADLFAVSMVHHIVPEAAGQDVDGVATVGNRIK